MKEQKYFERNLVFACGDSRERLYDLLNNGWKIILAIPIQSGQSCHTYTSAIHYVLEREVEINEKED